MKLTDVARLETGHTPSRKHPEYWGGDVPWIGIKDATSNHGGTVFETIQYTNDLGIANSSARILPAQTVCLSRTASVGYVVVMGSPMATSQDFVNWVCDESQLHYDFLKYVLLAEKSSFLRFSSGTTHQTIYFPEVKAFHICMPDLDTQKRISNILRQLDDKIELNRQINSTLESMAQALFKSWFVDFDPVIDNALAAGNPIPEPLQARADKRAALMAAASAADTRSASATDNALPTQTAPHTQPGTTTPATPLQPLPADLCALFPDSFVFQEEMGWVPEGWQVSTAGDEFTVLGGSTPSTKKPEYWENGEVHWTTPKDLSGSQTKLLIDTERRITAEGLQTITSGLLPVNTVLMSSRAPVGYLAIGKVPLAINQGYIALTCKNTCSPEYAIQWLESIIDHVKSISGGTTFAEISKKTFRGIKLIVPAMSAVNSYTEIVRSNYEKILANEKETRSLVQVRDSLLPKLLSGKLKVGEGHD